MGLEPTTACLGSRYATTASRPRRVAILACSRPRAQRTLLRRELPAPAHGWGNRWPWPRGVDIAFHVVKRAVALSVALAAVALSLIRCSTGEGDSHLAAQGAELYAQNCQTCHGDAATGVGRLTPLIPSHGQDGHTWHHADGQLADIILGRLN
jgi:mono/diheme cytochrome c family protein